MSEVTLNYVWINARRQQIPGRRKFPWSPKAEMDFPLPTRYQEKVRQVRANHPDFKINLWMDTYKREDESGELTAQFEKAADLGDVTFRALREIPEYSRRKLFQKDGSVGRTSHGLIWQQVDLARLLVLKHQMEQEGGHQIYSDFDISTFMLMSDALDKLKNSSFLLDSGPTQPSDHAIYIENRFLGLNAENDLCRQLIDELIDVTNAEYRKFSNFRSNGWAVFSVKMIDFKNKYMKDIPYSDLSVFAEEGEKIHEDYPGFRV